MNDHEVARAGIELRHSARHGVGPGLTACEDHSARTGHFLELLLKPGGGKHGDLREGNRSEWFEREGENRSASKRDERLRQRASQPVARSRRGDHKMQAHTLRISSSFCFNRASASEIFLSVSF